jgi:XTP/dITP diphosphohydrolase
MKLVLASNNAKKLSELRVLLDGLGLEVVAQGQLGVAEADEPHHTFIENALAKARHAAAASGLAAIADDSGVCVDALGGAPGVASAHFAPQVAVGDEREARRHTQDQANNALLLQQLQGRSDRRAAFVSTLVALRHAGDPEPLIACGRWHGVILEAARGDQGFGYDPLMFVPALGCTVAELDAATKNAHSHRALAAAQMRQLMRQAWHLG